MIVIPLELKNCITPKKVSRKSCNKNELKNVDIVKSGSRIKV